MKRSSHGRTKATLLYPKHVFQPEDLLHFIEMDGFEDDWEGLGLDDDDLRALQIAIMAGGKNAPVIRGTGGLRKLRFAPEEWNVGKSGGARVCFAYFEEYGIVLLVVAYAKSEYDNISPQGRRYFKQMILRAQATLDRRKTVN